MTNLHEQIALLGAVIVVTLTAAASVYPDTTPLQTSLESELGLQHFAKEFGVTPAHLSRPPGRPDATVWIVPLYRPIGEDGHVALKSWAASGGTLVLSGDVPYANAAAEALGLRGRLSTGFVLDPLQNRRLPGFPEVTWAGDAAKTGFLNGAHEVVDPPPGTGRLLSSSFSFLDKNGDGAWQEDEPVGERLVAAEERVGRGSVILLGSPTLFVNGLLPENRSLVRAMLPAPEVALATDVLPFSPLAAVRNVLFDARQALAQPITVSLLLAVLLALLEPRWVAYRSA